MAALGGMILPALVYAAVNRHSPETLRGRAIPAATAIAYALGVLALLGSRVPASPTVFLTALAIIDDLGAVVIIALFCTADLSPPVLGGAAATLAAQCGLDRAGVSRLWPPSPSGRRCGCSRSRRCSASPMPACPSRGSGRRCCAIR